MNKFYKQREICWVDLEPTRGAETKKKRPCVILQSTMVNYSSKTVIVAPFLPNHKSWHFVVNVTPSKQNGLDKLRHINLKQLRVVDVSRITNQQGMLEEVYVPAIKEALSIVLNFEVSH